MAGSGDMYGFDALPTTKNAEIELVFQNPQQPPPACTKFVSKQKTAKELQKNWK